MKKFTSYILISVALAGIFSSAIQVNAQAGRCIVTLPDGSRTASQELTTQAQCNVARGAWVSACNITNADGTRTLQIMPQTQCTEKKATGAWVSACNVTNADGTRTLQIMPQDQCTKVKGAWVSACNVTNADGTRTLQIMPQTQCTEKKATGAWVSACNVTNADGTRTLQIMPQDQCTAKKGMWVAQPDAVAPIPASTTGYTLLAPLPCPPGSSDCTPGQELRYVDPGKGLGNYLNLMIKIFIGLCAVLSVVMIVIGGIEYMTSELSHTKEAGKERIRNALLGLIIALGAYALLFTINPNLLKTDFNKLEPTAPAATTVPVGTTTQPSKPATTGTNRVDRPPSGISGPSSPAPVPPAPIVIPYTAPEGVTNYLQP